MCIAHIAHIRLTMANGITLPVTHQRRQRQIWSYCLKMITSDYMSYTNSPRAERVKSWKKPVYIAAISGHRASKPNRRPVRAANLPDGMRRSARAEGRKIRRWKNEKSIDYLQNTENGSQTGSLGLQDRKGRRRIYGV
jgi:hypothetical protein